MLAIPDYAMIVDGHLPGEKAEYEFLTAIAPGKSLNEMLKLGIENDHQLIGLIDIARNYPKDRIWHIGLLLLHTSYRGKGIGRFIVDEIEAMAKSEQISQLRIDVIEENDAAILFWQKIGFREISRIPNRVFGRKMHTIIEFARDIH